MIVKRENVICFGKNKIYFEEHGYLCSALKSNKLNAEDNEIKPASIRKLGLVEESFKGGQQK